MGLAGRLAGRAREGAGDQQGTKVPPAYRSSLRRQDRVCQLSECNPAALEPRIDPMPVQSRVPDAAGGKTGNEACPRGGTPADVDRDDAGLVPHLVPGRPRSPAEVDVLSVMEELLVPTTQLLQESTPHQHARARDPIDPPGMVVGTGVADDLVGPGRVRKESMEEERLRVGRAQAREASQRVIESAVLVDEARRDETCRRTVGERGREPMDRVGGDTKSMTSI